MTALFTVDVRIKETIRVGKANIVYFDGEASGKFFNGKIVGDGADVQISDNGGVTLSARYVLEGTDCARQKCRIYIENNAEANKEFTRPKIITDSEAL